MIYGSLFETAVFSGSPSVLLALGFLKNTAAGIPDGRHDLRDGIYAEIKRYRPAAKEQRPFESHRNHVDIQCVVDGEEMIYVRSLDGLEIREDLFAEKDIAFYHPHGNGAAEIPFLMRPGHFLILPPADAHKTECLVSAAEGRKVIIKIPFSLYQPEPDVRQEPTS